MESIPSTKRGPVAWLQKLDCGASMWLGLGALAVPVVICWRSIAVVEHIPGVGGELTFADFKGSEWLALCGVLAGSAVLWLAFLGVLIGKLLRGKPAFEKVFLALCLGGLPWLCMEGILIRARKSAAALEPAQALTCVSAVVSIALTLVLMSRLTKLGWVRGIFAALPFVVPAFLLGALGPWEETLLVSGAKEWNEARGERVSVFYEDTLPVSQANAFAAKADKWLPRITRKLACRPLNFRPSIYIIHKQSDYDLYGGDHDSDSGITLSHCILLRENLTEDIGAYVAHELTHLVTAEAFGDNQPALLNEGLAEYLQHLLSPTSWDARSARQTFLSIRTLSNDDVFYSDDLATNIGLGANGMYGHASGLVRYLTETYGWKKYLEFHRLSSAPGDDHATAMERASRELFHLSLPDLDRAWGKQAWGRKVHR